MLGVMQARKGVRLQGGVITMDTATATPSFLIFAVSNYAAQIGVRTFRIKRIKGINNAGVNTEIHLGTGTGAGFLDSIPPLQTFDGLNFDFVEADLPEVEWNVDMTGYTDTATIILQVEIEELG